MLAIWFTILSLVYCLSTYLLFLRDGNFIVRLSSALSYPGLVDQTDSLVVYIDRILFHPNSLGLLLLAASGIGLFCAYLYFFSKKVRTNKTAYSLIVFFFLISFPILSTDVFDYHATNLTYFVHKANPWLVSPIQFVPVDQAINLGSWISRPSVYPPVSFAINSLAYIIFGSNPLLALIGYKLISLAFYFGCLWLVSHLAKLKKINVNKALYLIGLNPLFLIEFIGNAHNDLAMIFFFLASLYYLEKGNASKSAAAFGLSVLSKITIIIYLPVLVFYLFQKNKSALFRFSAVIVLVTAIGFSVLFGSLSTYLGTIANQNQTLLQSFPYSLRVVIDLLAPNWSGANLFAQIFPLSIFSFIYLKTLISKLPLFDKLASVMFAFLLVQITMLHPWYFSWILILAPFVESTKNRWIIIMTTLSATLRYLAYYLSLYFMPLDPLWQIVIYLSMLSPILIALTLPSKWYTDNTILKSLSCKNS